jgi:hypothetical protein
VVGPLSRRLDLTGEKLRGDRFTPLQRAIWLDAGLAAGTCLVLAQPKLRRTTIVIGAVAAIVILVAVAVQLGSEETFLDGMGTLGSSILRVPRWALEDLNL